MNKQAALVEAMARAIYNLEPFYMPRGQMVDGIEMARKFSFEDAPAYRRERAFEFARAALAAADAQPAVQGAREAAIEHLQAARDKALETMQAHRGGSNTSYYFAGCFDALDVVLKEIRALSRPGDEP